MKRFLFAVFLSVYCLAFSTAFCAEKVVVVPLGTTARTMEQSFTLSLPAAAFIPTVFQAGDPNVQLSVGTYISLRSADKTVGLSAPVTLQDGANITGLTCYVYDNSSENIISPDSQFFLWRRGTLSSNYEQVTPTVTFSTTGESENIQDFSAPSISYPAIDNSQYAYGIYVLFEISDTDPQTTEIRFYGCNITYTGNIVLP